MAADVPCRRRRRTGQLGETLIESLLAITILTLVSLISFAGLQTAIKSSSQHKESGVAETLLRSAAERLQNPVSTYVSRAGCSGAGTYTYLPTRVGYAIDVKVTFWVPPVALPASPVPPSTSPPLPTNFATPCPAQDPGLQRISLTLTTPSGFTERLDVLKRSN